MAPPGEPPPPLVGEPPAAALLVVDEPPLGAVAAAAVVAGPSRLLITGELDELFAALEGAPLESLQAESNAPTAMTAAATVRRRAGVRDR